MDHLRNENVFNNIVEHYEHYIFIASYNPIDITITPNSKGSRVMIEAGNTNITVKGEEDEQ